jgi:hypothetical protein
VRDEQNAEEFRADGSTNKSRVTALKADPESIGSLPDNQQDFRDNDVGDILGLARNSVLQELARDELES